MIVTAGLRAAQILFGIIVLGLSVSLIRGQAAYSTIPSQTEYAAFCGGWAILIAVVGIVALFVDSLQGLIAAALDALSVLLTLAGGITLAATLGIHSCSDVYYTAANVLLRGNGDYNGQPIVNPDFQESDLEGRCHQAQAATAFLFFSVACFAATAALNVLRRDGVKGSIV